MELGRPTFMPVQDLEMGFEKIVRIFHALGGKIPFSKGFNQAAGSMEAIAKASKEYILQNTDLLAEKAGDDSKWRKPNTERVRAYITDKV
ncbi:hypothetical protein LguiA_017904 [Lonicera macranthoides]